MNKMYRFYLYIYICKLTQNINVNNALLFVYNTFILAYLRLKYKHILSTSIK